MIFGIFEYREFCCINENTYFKYVINRILHDSRLRSHKDMKFVLKIWLRSCNITLVLTYEVKILYYCIILMYSSNVLTIIKLSMPY